MFSFQIRINHWWPTYSQGHFLFCFFLDHPPKSIIIYPLSGFVFFFFLNNLRVYRHQIAENVIWKQWTWQHQPPVFWFQALHKISEHWSTGFAPGPTNGVAALHLGLVMADGEDPWLIEQVWQSQSLPSLDASGFFLTHCHLWCVHLVC